MNKLLLYALILLALSLPVFSFAATKSITVDWSMSDTTNVQAYKMYYSYSSDMAGKVLITTCAPWTEPAPNNFTMTCDNVTISSYPIYFIVTALTTDGDEINSATELVVASVSVVSDFQLFTPGDTTVSEPTALTCIGYEDSTSCELTSIPPDIFSASITRTYARKWTATSSGVLKNVGVYFTNNFIVSNLKVVVYGGNNGDTLIATGNISFSPTTWSWSENLVAETGQSLNFNEGDTLFFGMTFTSTTTYNIARTSDTGNNYYVYNSYLPQSPLWTSYNHDIALELRYEK